MQVKEIVQKYRRVFETAEYPLPQDTYGVVVLSGPGQCDQNGRIISEYSEENRARINFAVVLVKAIGITRNGETDWYRDAPRLILNGERNQLTMMVDYALQTDIPANLIELVDCRPRPLGNTKTQFQEMKTQYQGIQGTFLFVTSGYHVPRVELTAAMQLSQDFSYEVLPVPYEQSPFNIFKIRGEIRKIPEYIAKGDLAASFPTSNNPKL